MTDHAGDGSIVEGGVGLEGPRGGLELKEGPAHRKVGVRIPRKVK